MSKRRVVLCAGLTLLFALATANAFAEFRGTDVWSSITPGDGGDGLADRYPLSRYQLDHHVDAGITNTDGVAPSLMQFFSSWIFYLGAMAMRFVIYVFDWAFSVDFVNGSDGLLAPLSAVVRTNYTEIVLPFLVPAIIFLGGWAAIKALGRHRSEVSHVLVRTALFFVVSFAIAFYPAQTIGRVYSMVDGLSSAVVSRGGGAQTVSDALFETFVYRPWAVLQFGGTEVCTGSKTDSDGFPLAATDSNPATTCHPVFKKGADGHGDYARRFLKFDYDSDERKAEYDALREGEAPDDPQFHDTKIDKTDAPAVDMMQAGGAGQRMVFVFFVALGMLGGILLLGLLSIAALFAQVVIALAFVASSFAILAAILPITHPVVDKWLRLLGKALVGKLVYALLLAVVLTTSAALLRIGGDKGFLLAFFTQAMLFLGVFFKRKALIDMATSSRAAHHYSQSEHHATAFVAGAAAVSLAAVTDGASTFATTMRQGWSGGGSGSGSSAPPPPAQQPTQDPDDDAHDDQSQVPPPPPVAVPSAQGATMGQTTDTEEPQAPQEQETDVMLRPFSEDLERAMDRQRAQQSAQADPSPVEDAVADSADEFGGVVTEPREMFADPDSAQDSPEPVPYEQARLVASSRVATSSNFRDQLAQRTAESKTAGEVDCETFDFDALDGGYYDR